MRPVDGASLGAPLIDSAEGDLVAHRQTLDARRHVDVVSHEKRLTGIQADDEALVTAAFVVVGEQPHDGAAALHLEVVDVIAQGRGQDRVAALTRDR